MVTFVRVIICIILRALPNLVVGVHNHGHSNLMNAENLRDFEENESFGTLRVGFDG